MIDPKSLQARAYDALEPDESRQGWSPISSLLVALVLLSFVTLALETEAMHPNSVLPAWSVHALTLTNIIVVSSFAIEYFARLWAVGVDPRYRGFGGRLRYVFTPMALADLAAFLPELVLSLLNPAVGGTLFAALRALRLFRLFKLARYVPAFAIIGRALQRSWPPLLATLFVAGVQIYVAALTIYLIEGAIPEQSESFGSVTRALWWAVITLTTVGYGDVYPVTLGGKIAGAIMLLTGIGIVAMPTGILASAFAEEYRERQAQKQGED